MVELHAIALDCDILEVGVFSDGWFLRPSITNGPRSAASTHSDHTTFHSELAVQVEQRSVLRNLGPRRHARVSSPPEARLSHMASEKACFTLPKLL